MSVDERVVTWLIRFAYCRRSGVLAVGVREAGQQAAGVSRGDPVPLVSWT